MLLKNETEATVRSAAERRRFGYGIFSVCGFTAVALIIAWTISFNGIFAFDRTGHGQTPPTDTAVVPLDSDGDDSGLPAAESIPEETLPDTTAAEIETEPETDVPPAVDSSVPFDIETDAAEPDMTEPAVTEPPSTPPVTEPPPPAYDPPAVNPPVSADNYDFNAPVPLCEAVDDSYFADAIFIGDSRTVGFSMHTGIKSNYYAKVALTIGNLSTKKFLSVTDENGEELLLTVMEALEYYTAFSKVYISFGLNEMWWSTPTFLSVYTDIVRQIKTMRPDVAVYVQGIIPITAYASKNNYPDSGNPKLMEFNAGLAKMCADEHVYYLDLFADFDDGTGALPSDAGSDGVHFAKKYYIQWADYLRRHVVALD